MNPHYYNLYTAAFNSVWNEFDLLIFAGMIGILAFFGLMAICAAYILWTFEEIL